MRLLVRVYTLELLQKGRKMSFLLAGVIALLCLQTVTVYAQSLKVSGKLIDATTKEALVGGSISVKGTNQGTTADASGQYSISVNSSTAVLEFKYVGYATKSVAVGNQSIINVSLAPNAADLEQVVVVGYGTQKKTDVTGSVKSVASAAFNKGIINSPEQLLQGKVAGVNVTSATGEPGGTQGITIRGPGGIRSGSTPLFVIDGLALDNSSTGGGNPLNFINPQDIETIDVLKDASATAIYGSRGANGVILVTTKKGKAGTSKIEFSTSVGVSSITRALPVLSATEFRKQVVANSGILEDFGANTDWQKEITRQAMTKNYNLSLGGGANKLTYYAAFGAQMQQGILKNNQLDRLTGRMNVNQKFWDDRLNLDANLSFSNTVNERPAIESLLGTALSNNPTLPTYAQDGKTPATFVSQSNPLTTLQLFKDINTTNRFIANISPSVKLTKGLVYRMNFGYDNSTSVRDVQTLASNVPKIDGRLDTYNTSNLNNLIENYLTYNLDLGDHSFAALVGHSYQKIQYQWRTFSINKFPIVPTEPIYNPGIGQELTLATNKPAGSAFINELQSFYTRLNYQYQDKYLATATVRGDGSSKFGSNNRYGIFPSFSLGWRISEEPFLKNTSISNLKLRGGWGQTGNQEIPPKITQPLFTATVGSTTSYPLESTGSYPAGITYSRLANPDIQWEVSTQMNLGLDFAFLNGALSGSIDAFNKVSTNMLLEVIPADPVQPASSVWTNVANMEIVNRGVEMDLDYKFETKSGIKFNVGGNLTLINNEVKGSPYSVIPSGSASGSGLTSATINGYINGQPIGTFFLKEFIGFDDKGMSKYKDQDGDGIITDKDRIAAGTALPTTQYNFFGNASYKGFDLSLQFNGVSGNKIYDNTANASFYKLKIAKNTNVTPAAFADFKESINNAAPISTRYLKDAAFLRLNNLTLGYQLPTAKMGISKFISSARLSLTGQNLWVKTKYDGYDPEVNKDNSINGVLSYGIDYLSYPKAKSVIVGLNLTF
ncbi:TonB-dependent receptor [Aquirufa sp. LEPPI-3A]|uniref:SusC/RagA family TonB-linked outer membrane protein n=1 Tax=Aquirufa regiilacus TaxID=3024868 RepID=UPI0028DFC371|nr:TonB-dependent receptor [Aquirufa sp. LEPPI-3A]MDT8886949.1 TonB-dependent receptor [Aquirufa sp. LEPPI-3A]